jgi:hypothetical protein
MSETTSPEAYFTRTVPEQYARAIAGSPAAADQPELTAVVEISGPGGGTYGLRLAGGALEVVPAEQIASADLRAVMSYDDWRTFAASGATDPVVDYAARGKVGVVKGLKGTVQLELTRTSGDIWRSTTVFGGQDEPALTLMMTDDDYRAMLSGDLNGQMAFLTGKLKFEGSLPLLMQIGALTS